ncbi:phosphatase PAP2 family protein [Massilia sp. YIM B04103]|uniref:phosphatase PAP2 family protein n=1 Tax=Massilia sp. YIM B04103 TaxID=2963106 RepID=UPI00210D5545|nr:phosphatase PAP2 family protein [Massilia sp. YIM B04103]
MMNGWQFLSILGSLNVTGPLGVAIAVWLLAGKSWRLTLNWCLLFGVGMALVVGTKVAYLGWGLGVPEVQFAGISGHAMRACAVFPVAAYLASRHRSLEFRYWVTGSGVLLSLLVSISRVPVLAHSWSEVITGAGLGLAVAGAFIWSARTERHVVMGRVLAVLCLPVLVLAPRAEPAPTEQWMRDLALYLSGKDKPHERTWQLGPPKNGSHSPLL